MNAMSVAMLRIREFCRQNNIEPPTAIEFRFDHEGDAYRFSSALVVNFQRDGSWVADGGSAGVTQVCGQPIHITFQRHGPPYVVSGMPQFHPTIKRK